MSLPFYSDPGLKRDSKGFVLNERQVRRIVSFTVNGKRSRNVEFLITQNDDKRDGSGTPGSRRVRRYGNK